MIAAELGHENLVGIFLELGAIGRRARHWSADASRALRRAAQPGLAAHWPGARAGQN